VPEGKGEKKTSRCDVPIFEENTHMVHMVRGPPGLLHATWDSATNYSKHSIRTNPEPGIFKLDPHVIECIAYGPT
jgi:hypothetical protein